MRMSRLERVVLKKALLGINAGMVGAEFYKENCNDIIALVSGEGKNITDLVGHCWDEADPHALDEYNQGVLARYAFETISMSLYFSI